MIVLDILQSFFKDYQLIIELKKYHVFLKMKQTWASNVLLLAFYEAMYT